MPLATWLIKLYPRAWRQRYEEEMLALLEQHHVTLLTVLDLLFGMIKARLDPQYRNASGPVLFTSAPTATWIALAAWGVFVLCVAVASGPIELAVILFFIGHRDLSWGACCGSILASPGGQDPMAVMGGVAGSHIWFAEPLTVLLPLFAITVFACLGCLRGAVRTRRWGIIILTAVWFALPVGITLWLVIASPDRLNSLGTENVLDFHTRRDFQLTTFPLSLVTTVGELEALMAVLFLSVLKTRQALRTQRYRLLALVAGVNLVLILVAAYLIQGFGLFAPMDALDTLGASPDLIRETYIVEALGLCAHLLPFAAVGLLLLTLGGHALGKQRWQAVVIGVRLLAVLMAICDVCLLIGMIISWQLGEGMAAIPVVWAPGTNNSWYVTFFIPLGAIWATMVLAFLVTLRALHSMRAAGATAGTAPASSLRAPA